MRTGSARWGVVGLGLVAAIVGGAFAFGVPEPQGCGGVQEEVGTIEGQAVRQLCNGRQRELSTDSNHCGACNHPCLGGTCKQGKCQPFVLAYTKEAKFLALDSTYAYWTSDFGTVNRVPLVGGPVTVLATPINPRGIAIDSSHVYFTSFSSIVPYVDYSESPPPFHKGGMLHQVPLAGGVATELPIEIGDLAPDRIFLTGDDIYFLAGGSIYGSEEERESAPKALYVMPKGGGTTSVLVNQQKGRSYSLNGSNFFWKKSSGSPGQIYTLRLNGGSETVLANAVPSGGRVIAADLYRVLFTADSGIYWIPTSGGQAPVSVYGYRETANQFIGQLALDSQNLYWSEIDVRTGNSVIRKKGLSGTPNVMVANVSDVSSDIVVDANAIYIAGKNSIWKIAK